MTHIFGSKGGYGEALSYDKWKSIEYNDKTL